MANKEISLQEFMDEGYLQEANRLFFHHMGLALSITKQADGTMALGPIFDCRDDPAGLVYADEVINSPGAYAKMKNIDGKFNEKTVKRFHEYGFVIQPIPKPEQK